MKYLFLSLFFVCSLTAQNVSELCKQLVGDGSGKDAKARIQLMKLTHNAAKSDDSKRKNHEAALLSALQSNKSFEVATFLIQQLEICGGKEAITFLNRYLADEKLCQNATRTLTELAPYDRQVVITQLANAVTKSNDSNKIYLVNALSVLKANDDKSAGIFRSSLNGSTHLNLSSLQGLAQIGAARDATILLKALQKATTYRGRVFRLNLVFTKSLAKKDKAAANQHLKQLQSQIKKTEIPFITGIASVDFDINGVSDKWLKQLPTANVHTQIGIIRLLKAGQYANVDKKLAELCSQNPDKAVYLQALVNVNANAAGPFVLKGLQSKDQQVRELSSKLAVLYGDKFAASLVKALLKKDQIDKKDVELAKSMINAENVTQITALWQGLNDTQTLAFIEMTALIQNPQVAAKMIQAAGHQNTKVKKASLKALKDVVDADNFTAMKTMLAKETSSSSVRYLQAGIASSLALSKQPVIDQLVKELSAKRNDKLLVAFAKSNRREVLPLLKKDALSGSTEIQKDTIKTLSAMAPELSAELLAQTVEKAKDDRNRILAARALAEAATNSTQAIPQKRALLERALKTQLPEKEKSLLQERLKKMPLPKANKKKKGKAKPSENSSTYSPLFNGKDLNDWDNSGDYKVVNGIISGTKGQLWTKKSYKDFSFKFEFKLEPGTNNGLGIRTPKGSRPIELQIIDNGHPKYAKIKDYQRHGSLYNYAAAKTGHLKKTGEWNTQEVICQGSNVTVILNGNKILEADLSSVKPIDNKYVVKYINEAKEGRIGFLGHRTPVHFRNIEIKEF